MTSTIAPAARKVRVVIYRGSVIYFQGQQMKVTGYDAATDRYTLEHISGNVLSNVRRQSFIG